MSWEAWVQNLLQYPGVNTAAICGVDGSVWAKSANINPTDKEVKDLVEGLKKASVADFTSFSLGGDRYMVLRIENGELMAKRQCYNVAVMMATSCLVIGGYTSTGDEEADRAVADAGGGPKVNMAVAKIRDCLAESGM